MPNQINIITATDLCLHYAQKTVLDKVNFNLPKGKIVGVVGRNGSGKSTLLKILAGELQFDSGLLQFANEVSIGYVPQEFHLEENQSICEVFARNYFDSEQNLDDLKIELNKDLHWEFFEKMEKLLADFHCPSYQKLISELSGGEKRRIALCSVLIKNPNVLILDEPTNHLDMQAIETLELFLQNFDGSTILVSHDRYFLDRVADYMLEIFYAKTYLHKGNYTDYLHSKAVRLEIEATQYEREQKHLNRELEWVNQGVEARGTKDKGRLQRYYDLKATSKSKLDQDIELHLPTPLPLSNKILKLTKVDIAIENKKIVENLSLDFVPGQKLGLLGINGSGKTSLIKAILGQMPINRGKIVVGQNVFFNYQDQNKQNLNLQATIFEEVGRGLEQTEFGNETISTRKYLRQFLFDNDKIQAQIKNLSGGEKARVILAKILKTGGNFLILDEPTNDLDLETLRVLEDALIEFEGCVIIVSHDRFFLNRVCNHILSLDGDGRYTLSTGNYDDYISKYKPETKFKEIDIHPSFAKDPFKKTNEKLKLQKAKESKEIESKIKDWEKKIIELEREFGNPEFYQQDHQKIQKMSSKLSGWKIELERLYEKLFSILE